jgi:hypothetical protein
MAGRLLDDRMMPSDKTRQIQYIKRLVLLTLFLLHEIQSHFVEKILNNPPRVHPMIDPNRPPTTQTSIFSQQLTRNSRILGIENNRITLYWQSWKQYSQRLLQLRQGVLIYIYRAMANPQRTTRGDQLHHASELDTQRCRIRAI